MNNRQEEAVDKHSDELMKALRPSLNDSFLPYLEYRKVISAGNRLTIEGKRSDFDKMIILFDFLKVKEKGWQGLIDFLKQEGHPSLAKTLENSAKPVEQSVDRTEISFNSGFVSSPQNVEHLQQIHNLQNKVLTNNMKTLCEVLSPALILPYLAINQLLTVQEQQSITKNPENITDAAKIQALFHLMSGKPEWWDILMKYLADHRFGIRSKLDDELKKLLNQQGN